MNILQQEDIIKGLPDDALMQEAQAPSGQVPQFLVVSEIQRRSDMRKRYQEQQQPQGTVAEQIVGQAQQGIAAMQPQAGPMPPQAMPPQGMPPQMPLQGMQPQMPLQGMQPQMPPQQMFSGGIIRLKDGGSTVLDKPSVERPFYPTRANAGREDILPRGMTVRDKIQLAIQQGATMADLLSVFRNSPEVLEEIRMMYDKDMVDLYRPTSADIASNKFAGDTRRERTQDPSVSDMGADRAGSQFNYFQTPAFIGDFIQSGIGAIQKLPSDQDMIDFYRSILPEAPERGAAGEAGRQFGERVRGGVADLFDSEGREALREKRIAENVARSQQGLGFDPTEGSKGFVEYYTDSFQRGRDRKAQEIADRLESGGSGMSLAEMQFIDRYYDGILPQPSPQAQALDDASVQGKESGLEEVMVTGKTEPDARLSEDLQLAFDSLRATSGSDASAKDVITPQVDPALDLSDLVSDAQRMTKANALMQLGAGIAAGDLSQGLSRAGMAAAQGDQRAKQLAIRERLASYQAGREDLARAEQKRQFEEELDLKEDQYGRSLLQTTLSSIPDMIRQRQLELNALRQTLPEDDPQILAIVEDIKNLTNQYNISLMRAGSEGNDFSGYKVLSTEGA